MLSDTTFAIYRCLAAAQFPSISRLHNMEMQPPEILCVSILFAHGVGFPSSGYRLRSLAFILIHRFSFSPRAAIMDFGYAVPVLITEQRHAALPVRFPFRISRRMIGCNHSYYEPPISLNLRLRDTLPYRLLKAVFRYIHADIL